MGLINGIHHARGHRPEVGGLVANARGRPFPSYEDLNWTGLDFSADGFTKVTSFDKAAIEKRLAV